MKDIIAAYFPKRNIKAFSSLEEERGAYLAFVDLLCILSVQQNDNDAEEAISRTGALFSDEALMRSIEPHRRKDFPYRKEVREVFEGLLLRGEKSLKKEVYAAPLSRLSLSGALSPIEMLAVLLALAAQERRSYGQVFARLLNEACRETEPTVGLALDLGRLFLEEAERDVLLFDDRDTFLNSVLLVENAPEDGFGRHRSEGRGTVLERPLVLRQGALGWLYGSIGNEGELRLAGEYLTPEEEGYLCFPELFDELSDLFSYAMADPEPRVIELSGAYGFGKRYLLRRLSALSATPIIAIDAKRLFALEERAQQGLLSALCTKTVLEGSLPYLYNVTIDKEAPKELLLAVARLQRMGTLLFIGADKPLPEKLYESVKGEVYRLSVPEADAASQRQLWEEAAKECGATFGEDISLSELVSKYTMNPGRIFSAIKNAIAVSDIDEGGFVIKKQLLEEQIRRICSVQFGENAKKISSPFGWEDLIVEEESKKLLQMACDRVRFKSRINIDFGFGKKLAYGRGTSIVLYGPPGTGKTMAAGVLSNELGLDLYRIDLSQISSKYIGETEKNLGAVFDAAKNSNAILFFDEADAIFSKRTEVSSSNDKHANAETGYLLQKIEEYSGISILATNNMQNFDAAFKRRMTFLIPIGIPIEATRKTLWEQAFPPEAPLGSDVDFGILAKTVELPGSGIKNAAISAAYLAAAEDRDIMMSDIAEAVDMECFKNGKMGAKNDVFSGILAKGGN